MTRDLGYHTCPCINFSVSLGAKQCDICRKKMNKTDNHVYEEVSRRVCQLCRFAAPFHLQIWFPRRSNLCAVVHCNVSFSFLCLCTDYGFVTAPAVPGTASGTAKHPLYSPAGYSPRTSMLQTDVNATGLSYTSSKWESHTSTSANQKRKV
jgi:hypothetical protein